MAEDIGDLGGMVDPAVVQPKGPKWADLLADPVQRSALLSFGLQAMTGGWGNGTQQLAAAMGAGAQGAAGTAKSMQEQAINSRDFAAKQQEGEQNRASHEKIATISSSSREEIARARDEANRAMTTEKIAGQLERQKLRSGPVGDKETKMFLDYKRQHYSKLLTESGNPLSPMYKMPEEQLNQLADMRARDSLESARNASGVRSQGAPLESGATSGNSPGNAGGQSGGGTGTPGSTGGATSQTGGLKGTWEDMISQPAFERGIQTPAGQAKLREKRPDLVPQMEQHLQETRRQMGLER